MKHGTSPRAPQTLPPLTSAYNFTATYALASSVRYSGTISGVGYAHKRSTLALAYPNTQAPSQPNPPYANHHPKATPTGNFPLDLSYDGQPEDILPNPPSLPAPVVHSRGGKEVFRIWNANHGAHPTQFPSDKSTTSEALSPQLPSQIGPSKSLVNLARRARRTARYLNTVKRSARFTPSNATSVVLGWEGSRTWRPTNSHTSRRRSASPSAPYAGCGKRLSRPDALKRHMTIVHPLA